MGGSSDTESRAGGLWSGGWYVLVCCALNVRLVASMGELMILGFGTSEEGERPTTRETKRWPFCVRVESRERVVCVWRVGRGFKTEVCWRKKEREGDR